MEGQTVAALVVAGILFLLCLTLFLVGHLVQRPSSDKLLAGAALVLGVLVGAVPGYFFATNAAEEVKSDVQQEVREATK